MYSQNNEEQFILNYFKDQLTGTFLDAGAHDGKSLSNSRALVELGWAGVCIEPNPEVFEKLAHNSMPFKKVLCYELALGELNGTFELYKNDTYYSTLSETETKRWTSSPDIQFEKDIVEVLDWKTFYKACPIKQFDFISIDCEGVDYEILSQINLDDVGCKMVCVETNGKETEKYIDYCAKFGMKVLHINAENLIMVR